MSHQIINTTLCYIRKGGKTLMLLRMKLGDKTTLEGEWLVPGGKFEPGESPSECVIREVKEETGLTLEDIKLRGDYHFCYRKRTGKSGDLSYICV